MNYSETGAELGFSNDYFKKLMKIFQDAFQKDLKKLNDNIPESEFRARAHSIKGAALNLGLTAIADAARRLETPAGLGERDSILDELEQAAESIDRYLGEGNRKTI